MTFPILASPPTKTPHGRKGRWQHALLALFSSGLLAATAHADRPATFWTATTGSWFVGTNWTNGTGPSTSADAKIDNGGTVMITTPGATVPYAYLGSNQNTSGTMKIMGAGTADFTTIVVGALNSVGTLEVSGGGKLNVFGGPIGSDYLATGFATVDGAGSKWTIGGGEMVIGGNGTGTLYLKNSGNVTVDNGLGRVELGNHPISGGTLYIGNGGLAGTLSASEIYNGQGDGTVIFNHTNSTYSFAPKFTGIKSVNGFLQIRQEGSGTTVLTATESNLSGGVDDQGVVIPAVVVSGGTLIVNGKLMGANTTYSVDEDTQVTERNVGTNVVLAGGTLGGTGFLEGATTNSGTLSPGMSAGVLKFGGDLSLLAAGTVKMELAGLVRGTQFDGINVAGKLIYGGTLRISMLNGYVLHAGESYDLFDGYSSYEGNFSSILFDSGNLGGSFNPQTGVLSVIAVPEPSAVGLVAFGTATLALHRRKREHI